MTNNTTADTTPSGAGEGGVVAWIRFCSDGLYEGPIHDSQIDEIRRRSGVWTPLVPKVEYDTLRAQLEAAEAEVARLAEIEQVNEIFRTFVIGEGAYERFCALQARVEAAEADAAMLKEEHDDLFNTLRAASNYVDALGGRSEVYRRVLARNERPIDAAKAPAP